MITMLGDVSTDELSRTARQANDRLRRLGRRCSAGHGRAAGTVDGDLHRLCAAALSDP